MSYVKYSGPLLKWTREELQYMDKRTRKLITMHLAILPKDDVDRLHLSKKKKKEEEDSPAFKIA